MSNRNIDQSVTSLYSRYLSRQDLKPNSVVTKKRALRYYLEIVGDSAIAEVTPADAEDFKACLVKDGVRSLSSANTYLNVFKPFFVWCQGHGYIKVNPFYGVGPYKTERKPPVAFEGLDLGRMASNFDCLWRVRLALGLNGCRRGEMLSVIVKEINMDTEDPHIQLGPKKRSENTWPWSSKTYKTRYIPLPERMIVGSKVLEVHRDIVQLIERLPANQPYVCLEPRYFFKVLDHQANGTLCQDILNDPTGNFQRMFGCRQRHAGIRQIKRYHELRAMFLTQVCNQHGIQTAADAAGIVSLQTAARYDRTSTMATVHKASSVSQSSYAMASLQQS